MKPKRIVREPEACNRLACKRTKFRTDYRFSNPADPTVPGTRIPRLRAVPLGPRNVGFLEAEIDDLVDGLAALRDAGAPRTAIRREPEQRCHELLERRRRLRAQLAADPDPEIRARLKEVDRELRAPAEPSA